MIGKMVLGIEMITVLMKLSEKPGGGRPEEFRTWS